MRFLDANVFIYAYYKPRKKLSPRPLAMKTMAKEIISRISEGGEEVVTSIVHVSEVCNIVKKTLSVGQVIALISSILESENIKVVDVSVEMYKEATALGQIYNLEPNDALAVLIMEKRGLGEIYTFDSDFDSVDWIVRIPSDEQIERKAKQLIRGKR